MINLPFKKIHMIAIGGSVMHQLAITLKNLGLEVSGSDDEIFDPAKSHLNQAGLLPEKEGWDPEKITNSLDAVVLGMHAREDNPELKKAQELGLPIFSFPEFIFENARDKQRIVIAGSHGKTTVTSIIMHILKYWGRKFDYVVGAAVEGFDSSVQITDAPVIIIEGDEYASSSLDKRPKILNYHHHIGVMNGIAWDHINMFKTEDDYVKQFELFADASPKAGALIYNEEDAMASVICAKEREDVQRLEYGTHPYEVVDGKFYLVDGDNKIEVNLIGKHNMINVNAARKVLNRISISDEQFYEAIKSYKGASKRLEVIAENNSSMIFRDYAHSPSKVAGSVNAVKEMYPNRSLVACLELHTFSSLSKEFIDHYQTTLDDADQAIVYFNPKAVELKRLPELTTNDITDKIDHPNLQVFDDSNKLLEFLQGIDLNSTNLLLMSSGNFDNLNFGDIIDKASS